MNGGRDEAPEVAPEGNVAAMTLARSERDLANAEACRIAAKEDAAAGDANAMLK